MTEPAAGRKAMATRPEAHRSRPAYPAGPFVRREVPQGLLKLSGAGEAERCWRADAHQLRGQGYLLGLKGLVCDQHSLRITSKLKDRAHAQGRLCSQAAPSTFDNVMRDEFCERVRLREESESGARLAER